MVSISMLYEKQTVDCRQTLYKDISSVEDQTEDKRED